ncbi:MAG: hypothetical protein MRY64_16640 [Hyphomonadaceae bacterium]|nr:hypothetical protein [Hyphomonadaceae bacterium]
MSLTVDGRAVLETIVNTPDVFSGIPARDWSSAAIKLAKKQVNAGKQTREDILRLRNTLGEDVFAKTLDALSAHHMKMLARRVDPDVDADEIKTASMALTHIRTVLSSDWKAPEPEGSSEPENAEAQAPKANPYIGRKAFRTGR